MTKGSFGAHQARNSATKDPSGGTGVAWLTWFGAHSQRDQLSQSNSPEGSWRALCPGATSQDQVASRLLLGHSGQATCRRGGADTLPPCHPSLCHPWAVQGVEGEGH